MLQLAARMLTRTDPAATRVINILWPTRAAKIFDSGAQKYLDPSPQQQHHAVPQREEDCNCHTDSYYHSGSILDKKNIEVRIFIIIKVQNFFTLLAKLFGNTVLF